MTPSPDARGAYFLVQLALRAALAADAAHGGEPTEVCYRVGSAGVPHAYVGKGGRDFACFRCGHPMPPVYVAGRKWTPPAAHGGAPSCSRCREVDKGRCPIVSESPDAACPDAAHPIHGRETT